MVTKSTCNWDTLRSRPDAIQVFRSKFSRRRLRAEGPERECWRECDMARVVAEFAAPLCRKMRCPVELGRPGLGIHDGSRGVEKRAPQVTWIYYTILRKEGFWTMSDSSFCFIHLVFNQKISWLVVTEFYFPFHIWWCHPSHWRTPSFFKMGTLHHQPVKENLKNNILSGSSTPDIGEPRSWTESWSKHRFTPNLLLLSCWNRRLSGSLRLLWLHIKI